MSRVHIGRICAASRLIGQITGALHACYLIGDQVILVSIVFESTATQDLPISPVALIGNGRLPTFISQQNELLLGMIVDNLVCQSREQP